MDYRIGQFNDTYPPLMDGVAIVMLNYAHWLNRCFGTCYSIVPYFPGPNGRNADSSEIPVLRYLSVPLPFRSPYRIGMPWFDAPFRAELHKLKLDLVHSHNPFSAGVIARSYARKHRVPMVSTFHSSIHDFVDGLLHSRRITQMIVGKVVDYYESMDRVWVSSHFTRDVLKSYGYRGEPEIIPHGIDFVPPADFAAAREAANGVLGTDPSDNVLLYVGYLSREKNLEFLLKALSLVKKRNVRFKMFLVGEGYARAELQRQVRDIGLGDDVRFAGVIREREQLRHWYARANLFLFPSFNDTYSLVVREAAAFAVPSVILQNTTTAEVIRDSVNGFITERRVDAYAEKIAFLLSHPEDAKTAGRAAFQTLYHSWESIMDTVMKKYRCLIAGYHL